MTKFYVAIAAAVLTCGLSGIVVAQEYDHTFLADYSRLKATPLKDNKGTDLLYTSPGVFDRLGKYTDVMVDEVEVLMSAQSDYKGAKPTDLQAVGAMIRKAYIDELKSGGYGVVESPGPTVIYIKLALTDLRLQRKKRGLLAYTPIGFVLKAGADALRDMMQKYDIMGGNIQGQITDSVSNDVLAEFVGLRGNNGQRMDFGQVEAEITAAASRGRCRLDNTHVPADQRIDCLDPAARAAREAKGPVFHR